MSTHTILVIEDSDEDFAVLERALKTDATTVKLDRCASAAEAFDFLQRCGTYAQAPRPALILLDLNLPGLDGRAVLQRLKQDETLKPIPVVVLTTSSNPRDILECYHLGANSYQIKTVNYPAYKAALQQMLSYWFGTTTLPAAADE
ncbi:MAG TPA: response regulator [Blastocatellia bacterium]|nr:response regulator [Blastocatellia bacterium]